MPSRGRAVIAAAGSGKTQRLVEDALAEPARRVLITTYTRDNLREIEDRLWQAGGGIEHNVTTMSWFEFLLRDGVKPYQAYKTDRIGRVRSIHFHTRRQGEPGLRRIPKANFDRYYLDGADDVYDDAVADLACLLDEESGGKVVTRLVGCYDAVFVDEMQDLASHDLLFLERMLRSDLDVQLVGDPRQAVYSTNGAPRYRQYRRGRVVDWIEVQERANLLTIEFLTDCHRCNQPICDFADRLYPDLPATASTSTAIVHDMGVHLVDPADLDAYRTAYMPQELRWSKATAVDSEAVLNFGEVKGACFDRVLIHATAKMTDYIDTGADLPSETRAKLYVAVTRARHSVAIVPKRRVANSSIGYWVSSA